MLTAVLAGAVVAGADRGVAALIPAMLAVCVLQAAALVVARIEPSALAIVALAAAFVASHDSGPSAAATAIFAGGLLVVAELATWSFERQTMVFARPRLDASRWLYVVTLAAGGVVVALAIMWLGSRAFVTGLVFEIAGVTAAAALIPLVVWTAIGRGARAYHEPPS